MADKYYRLVSFLVNICPQTLRELFIKYMKADLTRAPTCTTLQGYLASRKPQLHILRRRKIIRQYQWDLLFPQNGQVDESPWDTTLVILLIDEFFQVQLQKVETDAINDIRGVRNRLQHIADTSISDVDFNAVWKTLETATLDIARQIQPSPVYGHTIKEFIDDTKVNNMPKLGDTLRYWYESSLFKLQCDLEDMKEIMLEMSETTADNLKCTTDCRTILRKNVVTKVDSSGDKVKRMKTVDHILVNMNHTFIRTMNEDLKSGFQSSKEIADIKTKLRDSHHVIVTGIRGSRYLETAFAAIQDFGFNLNRCVEMRSSSDWRHIDPEEVDLVLCREPFGDFSFDENRAKSMVDIFDSMHKTTKPTDGSKFVAIIIVSDLDLLHTGLNTNEHDLLENVVHVYQQTSEKNPEDLTVSSRDREVSATLNNLLGDKVKRQKTVDNILANMKYTFKTTMNEDLKSGFQSPKEIADIKTKLRDIHHVIVTGIRGSRYLETALAAIQDFGFNLNRCVEMRSSSDWRHIDPEEVDLVLCREPFGDFSFDENRAKSMVDIFDSMHKSAKPTDGSKFVAIVIVSDLDLLHKVSNTNEHDLLRDVVHVYQQTSEKNPENLTVSCRDGEVSATLKYLLAGHPGTSFQNCDNNQPMTSFTGVKMIKNVDISPPESVVWHDFCQYIDGSYMLATNWIDEDQMKECVCIDHFSSDFQHIRQYQTDIHADVMFCTCICCTYTGELVVACDEEIHLYRITGEGIQLVKSILPFGPCLRLCSSGNRIACQLDGTCDIVLLDRNLNEIQTITLNRREFDTDEVSIFVPILNKTFVYCNDFNDDLVFEYQKKYILKYLSEEGFSPICACAAGEDSVFVLGIQDGTNSRILHVNTDAVILGDILVTKDELPLNESEGYIIEFDTSNFRLVLLAHQTNEIREIYLK